MSQIKILGTPTLRPIETNAKEYKISKYNTVYIINNEITSLSTGGMGPCIALGVYAKDDLGTSHRIIYHYDNNFIMTPYEKLEGMIEQYLKSLNKIVELSAIVATTDTFFEKELDDSKLECDIVNIQRLNQLFSFWKQNNPDFQITVAQSSYLEITPQGDFMIYSKEHMYQELITDKIHSNTIFNEEELSLDDIEKKLNLKKEKKY